MACTAGRVPVASFTASATNGPAPLTVTLTDTSTGFDRFSNAQLHRMFPQLFGADDEIAQW